MAANCKMWRVGASVQAAHALSGLSRLAGACRLPQSCNLEGISMNIQRKKILLSLLYAK